VLVSVSILIVGQQVVLEQNAVFLIIMKYFQILYPNSTIAIVAPCAASEQEKVIAILNLIQSRPVTDPYAIDLMTKLAAMLPRFDVEQKGFSLDTLSNETLEAIFYGSETEPCLIEQIHALTPHKAKPSDKLPLKLSQNSTANLVAKLIVISRETGCNTTDLIAQYPLATLDDMVRDFCEMVRPYEERVEEHLQDMWEEQHASKIVDPEFLFNLRLNN